MHPPKLQDLPQPPPHKTGWPWTTESSPTAVYMDGGSSWPLISIVTPSLNQGQFIEETIRSVLLQRYPRLEFIVIDGGSTDRTIDVLKKYDRWITFWVSEQDRGQSHAINKGFAKANGSILGYINSDDLYEPDAFQAVAVAFAECETTQLLAGECLVFSSNEIKRVIRPFWPDDLAHFVKKTYSSTFAQPSSFWTHEIYLKAGRFDETLHYCFDREFFLKLGLAGVTPHLMQKRFSRFREHKNSKTIRQAVYFHEDSIRILEKYYQACNVSQKLKRTIRKQIKNEIRYIETFAKWKSKGRLSALIDYLFMISKSPSLILERKILGQGRRLFAFKSKNVDELRVLGDV